MAIAASDAHLLLASATHGATAVGIVTAVNGTGIEEFVAVRGEAVTGPTSRGVVRRDSVVSVSFLAGSPIARGTAKASLIVVAKKMDGATSVTFTWTNMKPSTYSYGMVRESPPGEFTQEFVCEDSLATDNLSVT